MDMKRTLASSRLTADLACSVLKSQGLLVAQSTSTAKNPNRSGQLVTDSRLVQPGDIFLAYRGVHSDGHLHIPMAIERGAQLIIFETAAHSAKILAKPWLHVSNAREAWAHLAAAAHGNPEQKLRLFGVTGTNGKTSTVWMLGELLRLAGVGCLTLGTLGAYFGEEEWPLAHTTPDPDVLFAHLARAVALGLHHVAMEVSSHALCQGKIAPLHFEGTAFTSFSRDHLDFHPDLDSYWQAKLTLFTRQNQTDTRHVFAANLPKTIPAQQIKGELWTYREAAGKSAKPSELLIWVHGTSASGTDLTLTLGGQSVTGRVPYFSGHALQNFAAAYLLAAKACGEWLPSTSWDKLRPVPGRLEQVYKHGGPMVVVDYAHTPDALEKTLSVLRPLCRGRLILVFGCGGDRDRGKRPLMGDIACRLADYVVVTSDNPRSEDPQHIITEICAGLARTGSIDQIVDREQAIAAAIKAAGPDDVVLIAGKGHETHQIIHGHFLPFDDRLVAKRYLGSNT